MNLSNMFKKNNYIPVGGMQQSRPEVPDGLLKQCNKCKAAIYTSEVTTNHYICPKCKKEVLIEIKQLNISVINEPDA